MKKSIIVLALAILIVFAFSSCRKCETCTAYDEVTNIMVDEDHWCGMSLEVNSSKDAFKTEWDYGSTYVECEKD